MCIWGTEEVDTEHCGDLTVIVRKVKYKGIVEGKLKLLIETAVELGYGENT